MRTLLLLSALSIAALGCDKSDSPAAKAAASKTVDPTASAVADTDTEGAAVVAAAPEAVEAAAEEGSCSGDKGDCTGGCNQWDEAASDVAKREVAADSMWTVIAVDGMTCGGCERRIIANLGGLEGVRGVEADAELGEVRVATAPDAAEAQKSVVIAKITELGYKVR